MALLQEDRALATPQTPFPQTEVADVPDFTDLLLKLEGGYYKPQGQSAIQELGLALEKPTGALSLPELGGAFQDSLVTRSPGVKSWLGVFQKPAEYVPQKATIVDAYGNKVDPKSYAGGGSWGKGSGSGLGLSAYGYSGTTGVKGTKGSSPYGFQAPMWQSLQSAFAAMKAAGIGVPGITDGWRSYQAQVDVKRRKGGLAATPGRSIHGLGLAADLDLTGAQFNWLKKNGQKYGLVNLPSESWHWQMAPSMWKGWKK